ncbi:MAG TPA: hypothetical protein VHT97_15630 [Acidimicrobiales bacterium]|nr:hypothetical protein [Acidimicrobiales bacterium]
MIERPGRIGQPVVAAVVTLMVVVLAAGLMAAGRVDRGAGSAVQQVRTVGLSSSLEPDTEPPATTSTTVPQPAASTTSVLPTSVPTTSPKVTSVPTTVRRAATTTIASTTTTAHAVRATNGTGTWTGVTNGVSTTLRMEPVNPRVGDTVQFFITATYPTAFCCVTTFYAGDGSTNGPAGMEPHACPAPVPSTFTEQVDHTYSHEGTYRVEVQPSAGEFCTPFAQFVNAQLYVTVVIAPAA